MTFYVHNDGRLTFTRVETNLFSVCLHNEVSVVANDRLNWILDPNPQKVNLFIGVVDYGKETSVPIKLGA